MTVKDTLDGRVYCPDCGTRAAEIETDVVVLRRETGLRLNCPGCGREFTSETELATAGEIDLSDAAEAARNVADQLHALADVKDRQATWYREAANRLMTGEWGAREFIEKAESKGLDLAEELPEVDT